MGIIDIHSHLLPKVDDSRLSSFGFGKMMKKYYEAGVDKLVFTPHINDPYVNTKYDLIMPSFEKYSKKAEKYNIKTYLGCELFIKEGALPATIYPHFGKYVLCETHLDFAPSNYVDSLRELKNRGYEIIIAHIERYNWLNPESELFRLLKDELGVLIQVNASSVNSTKTQAYLTRDCVDFISSDNHGSFDLPSRLVNVIENHPKVYMKMLNFLNTI